MYISKEKSSENSHRVFFVYADERAVGFIPAQESANTILELDSTFLRPCFLQLLNLLSKSAVIMIVAHPLYFDNLAKVIATKATSIHKWALALRGLTSQ